MPTNSTGGVVTVPPNRPVCWILFSHSVFEPSPLSVNLCSSFHRSTGVQLDPVRISVVMAESRLRVQNVSEACPILHLVEALQFMSHGVSGHWLALASVR